MYRVSLLLALCTQLIGVLGTESLGIPPYSYRPLKIGAFNMQIFGLNKLQDATATDNILKIMQRYDIILMQEIRDASTTAFPQLMDIMKTRYPEKKYKYVISARLGRSTSKEQYAYVYREDLTVIGTSQYEDINDEFERPPFSVLFNSPTTVVGKFAMLGIHTKPSAADQEISSLTNVYNQLVAQWDVQDVIIGGDFNAECSYVTQGEWKDISLYTDKRFYWVTGNDLDTTTSATDCAYDRFVLAGAGLRKTFIPGTAGVFRFDDEYHLTPETTRIISDHYPIELQIEGKGVATVQEHLDAEWSFTIREKDQVKDIRNVRKMYWTSGRTEAAEAGFVMLALKSDTSYYQVSATCTTGDVIGKLQTFRTLFPGTITDNVVSAVKAHLESKGLQNPADVYGLVESLQSDFKLSVVCMLQSPYGCYVTVSKATTQ